MKLGSYTEVGEKDRPILDSTSRYEVGYQLSDGTYLWDTFHRLITIPESEDDLYHTLTAGEVGKFDKISAYYYGTPFLGWVIAMANRDAGLNPWRIEAGTRLRIPSITTVAREVL